MNVYEFDVAISEHPLKDNGLMMVLHNVQIMADNHTDAFYSAYAMAACHGVVTDIWDRI